MTVRELHELRHLKREIELNKARLASLETETETEETAALKERITENIKRCVAEETRLQDFIDRIPGSLNRTIFTLVFVAGMDYRQVSEALGGELSAIAVTQRVKRYVKQFSE